MAGATDIEVDAHVEFDEAFSPPASASKQDPEERRRLIAALAAQ